MVGHEYSEGDPYYDDLKRAQKFYDKLCAVEEIYGVPSYCLGCVKGIKKDIDEKGQHFYICTAYRDDGTHVRVCALEALADDVDMLKTERRKMRNEIDELKRLVKGSGSGPSGSH